MSEQNYGLLYEGSPLSSRQEVFWKARVWDNTLSEKHRYQKDDTVFLKNGICGDKKLIAQVEIIREDGTAEILAISDETWKMGESPVTFQNWYGGEDYDGRKAALMKGWDTPEAGFVPGIAPEYHRIGGLYKDPNWGGACVMTPWYYYQEYGDIRMLQDNFEMMKAYVGHLYRQSIRGVLKD